MECALKYSCGDQGTLLSLSKDFGNNKIVTMKMDPAVQELKVHVENKNILTTGLSMTFQELKTLSEIVEYMTIAEDKFRKPLPSDCFKTKEGFMILRRSEGQVEMYYEPLPNDVQTSVVSAINLIEEIVTNMTENEQAQPQTEQPHFQDCRDFRQFQPQYHGPLALPNVSNPTPLRPMQQTSCTLTRPPTQDHNPLTIGPVGTSYQPSVSVNPLHQQATTRSAFQTGSAFEPYVQPEPRQFISLCQCDAPICECNSVPLPAFEPITPVKQETKRKHKKLSLPKRKKSEIEIQRELMKIYKLTKDDDSEKKKEKKE